MWRIWDFSKNYVGHVCNYNIVDGKIKIIASVISYYHIINYCTQTTFSIRNKILLFTIFIVKCNFSIRFRYGVLACFHAPQCCNSIIFIICGVWFCSFILECDYFRSVVSGLIFGIMALKWFTIVISIIVLDWHIRVM